jgi:hypothetical protein
MSDEPDQRTELDDPLVVLRKVQKQAPDPATVKSAVAACKQISAMIRNGTAGEAHVLIREQLEERLAEI